MEILASGPLTTVQDAGRFGLAALGVGRSGAADPASYALANRLVGNPPGTAAVEVTMGGLAVRFDHAALVAVTGAPAPVTRGARAADLNAALSVPVGTVVRLGTPAHGVRSYLAVRGGIAVPAVLGSRATDVLAGLGPAPLRPGDRLPIGAVHEPFVPVDVAPAPPWPAEPVLRLRFGPRADWFTAAARHTLVSAPYTVSADSDRIGVRLAGPRLARRIIGELPPEGLVAGAVQVPPDGQPVLLLADHPVTGGYPVIGVLNGADLAAAAQARPGQRLRLRSAAGQTDTS